MVMVLKPHFFGVRFTPTRKKGGLDIHNYVTLVIIGYADSLNGRQTGVSRLVGSLFR